MNKGNLIGRGMTAEVYEWGQDKALKLYTKNVSKSWAMYEARIGTAIHEAGVASPEVFGTVEVDGRNGIIFQRIFGRSMLDNVKMEPWNIYHYIKQLARLQFGIHQHKASGLPSQVEKYAVRIKRSHVLPEDKMEKIIGYVKTLPDSDCICHGDLHFNNIIVSGNKLVPIDWTNAYGGNPLGDVARTCLILISPVKPRGTGEIPVMVSLPIKWLACLIYIGEYIRLSKARLEDIDAWILPTAAAKLRDKLPGEEKWLLDIINTRLNQLNLRELSDPSDSLTR